MQQTETLQIATYYNTIKQDLNNQAYNKAFDNAEGWVTTYRKATNFVNKKQNAAATLIGSFLTVFGIKALVPKTLEASALGGFGLLAGTMALSAAAADHTLMGQAVKDLKNGVLKDINTSAPVGNDYNGLKSLAHLQLARRKYLQAQFATALDGVTSPTRIAHIKKMNAQSLHNQQRRDVELRQFLAQNI